MKNGADLKGLTLHSTSKLVLKREALSPPRSPEPAGLSPGACGGAGSAAGWQVGRQGGGAGGRGGAAEISSPHSSPDPTPGFLCLTPGGNPRRARGAGCGCGPREGGRAGRAAGDATWAEPPPPSSRPAPARPRLPGPKPRALFPTAAGEPSAPFCLLPGLSARVAARRHRAMTTQQIVLQGPGPWGFRLVGGKDFEQPLAISRVRAAGDARGAGPSQAGEWRVLEGTWGGGGPAGAGGDGGFGSLGPSRDSRAHPGAPGAPSAFRAPWARGSRRPCLTPRSRASLPAAEHLLTSFAGKKGVVFVLRPGSMAGVWMRFVSRRGAERSRGRGSPQMPHAGR